MARGSGQLSQVPGSLPFHTEGYLRITAKHRIISVQRSSAERQQLHCSGACTLLTAFLQASSLKRPRHQSQVLLLLLLQRTLGRLHSSLLSEAGSGNLPS